MRPVIVRLLAPHLGGLARWVVPTYAVMLALGALAGAVLLVDGARRAGYPRRLTLGVALAAYVGGLAGAWAVPLAQGLLAYARTGRLVFASGMAAYGGLMGGVVAGVVVLRRARVAVLPFLDAAAPGMAFGYFLARIGCFLAGCDYGVPTPRPWGVVFPPGSHAFRDHVGRGWLDAAATGSLPVHPTQLYLSMAGLTLFFLVRTIAPRGDGSRFVAYAAGYALVRSAIELLRGDEGRGFVGPLSTSQALAIVSVSLTLVLVTRERRRVVASSITRASE